MQTSNSPASNIARILLGDVLGIGEAQLLHSLEIDAVDDLAAEVAAQRVGALAADHQDLDRLAVADQPLRIGAREPGDVGVEAAAQAALGRHHDEQVDLVLAGADQQRRGAVLVGHARVEVGQHAVHALGIGTGGGRGLLRAAQLGGGHHLHRLGDLARRLHRGDAVAHVFQ